MFDLYNENFYYDLKSYPLTCTDTGGVTTTTSTLPFHGYTDAHINMTRKLFVDNFLDSQLIGNTPEYLQVNETYKELGYSFDTKLVNSELIEISDTLATNFSNTPGSYTNTPTLRFQQTTTMNSAQFHSNFRYLSIPYTALLNTTVFTVAVWLYNINTNEYEHIVESRAHQGITGFGCYKSVGDNKMY